MKKKCGLYMRVSTEDQAREEESFLKQKKRLETFCEFFKMEVIENGARKSKIFNRFDNMLKDIDEEYRTTLINFGKYKLVMFAMAKLMEMETIEQNKVALYLFNNINIKLGVNIL